MKIFGCIIWQRKNVALGSGQVEQLTIFENKYLFSIWSYSWGNVGDQMRFHTHAFHSIAVTLWGSYTEEVLKWDCWGYQFEEDPGKLPPTWFEKNTKTVKGWWPRYLPRNYCHRIVGSDGARTLVLAGPWAKTWQEYFPDTNTWVTYTWGRNKI